MNKSFFPTIRASISFVAVLLVFFFLFHHFSFSSFFFFSKYYRIILVLSEYFFLLRFFFHRLCFFFHCLRNFCISMSNIFMITVFFILVCLNSKIIVYINIWLNQLVLISRSRFSIVLICRG